MNHKRVLSFYLLEVPHLEGSPWLHHTDNLFEQVIPLASCEFGQIASGT